MTKIINAFFRLMKNLFVGFFILVGSVLGIGMLIAFLASSNQQLSKEVQFHKSKYSEMQLAYEESILQQRKMEDERHEIRKELGKQKNKNKALNNNLRLASLENNKIKSESEARRIRITGLEKEKEKNLVLIVELGKEKRSLINKNQRLTQVKELLVTNNQRYVKVEEQLRDSLNQTLAFHNTLQRDYNELLSNQRFIILRHCTLIITSFLFILGLIRNKKNIQNWTEWRFPKLSSKNRKSVINNEPSNSF